MYTKADKLSRNNQFKHAAALDAGLTITPDERIVFSARTGLGLDSLRSRIAASAEAVAISPVEPPLTDPI